MTTLSLYTTTNRLLIIGGLCVIGGGLNRSLSINYASKACSYFHKDKPLLLL
ncbi:MAG: hypothetical protein LBN27_04355 [Prevotellaceae bacterium]|nr:hypothetical protein [Prevotellaceae bacterium]